MARVPYDTGDTGEPFPTVAPRETVPDDYQHIQANPDQFGGLVAKGEQQLGAGVSKAATFFGEVQTDDEANKRLTEVNGYLNEFRALRGADALNAQASTQAKIDAAFKNGRDALYTPAQQYQFDQIVRSYQQRYISGIMASHADQQAHEYGTSVNKNGFELAVNSAAAVADKPEMVAAFREDARSAAIKQLQLEGAENDPQAIENAKRRADQAVTKAVIQSISVNDPIRAQKMVEDNKAILGADYEPMANAIRSRSDHAVGLGVQRAELAKSYGTELPAPIAPASLPQMQGAIRGQESSNRDVVPASVTGAVGPNQIEPATFRQYARTGEDINNPADNRAVGDRIITDYYNRYNGDPYRVAVAYFSGPGNVAPAGSATPWLQNKADPTGKTVAAYVGDVAARLGVAPGAPYAAQAATERAIMLRTDISDTAKQYALAENERFFREATIASEADQRVKKQANDTARDSYTTQIFDGMRNNPGSLPALQKQIEADPKLDGPTKIALSKFINPDPDDRMQYGSAYSEIYSRIFLPPDDPKRINDANEILIAGSPGGGLTPNGTDRLMRVFAASRKDIDQASINQAKVGLINYAKSKLSFDQEMLFPGAPPMRDPKGAQIFEAQFIPKFESAYDAWIKAGKNPYEFLTQENIDKLMAGMRSPSQMAMDRTHAMGEATGEREQIVPPAPKGVSGEAWQNIMAQRPASPDGRPVSPANWWGAIQALQKDPSEKNIAYFNALWKDVDAAALLKQINGQSPPAASAPAAPAETKTVPAAAAPSVAPTLPNANAVTDYKAARDEALAHLGAPRNVRAELLQQAHPLHFNLSAPEGMTTESPEERYLSEAAQEWVSRHPAPRNVRTELLRQGAGAAAPQVDPTYGLGASYYRLTPEQQNKVRAAYERMVAAEPIH